MDQVDAIIQGKPLTLKNGIGCIRRRTKAAIILYFQANKQDTEHYVKTTILLFYRFIN